MPWTVLFHNDFEPDFAALPSAVRIELAARLGKLTEFGPQLGRPTIDTLKGSSFANMKEVRFRPQQRAIVLVGGDKEGADQKAFYKRLIRVADKRFAAHVAALNVLKGK